MLPAARNAVRNARWWDVPQSWTTVPVVLPGTSGLCRPADRRFRVLPAPTPGFRERTCLRRGQNARARRGREDVDRFLFAVFAYIQFFRCVEPGYLSPGQGPHKGCYTCPPDRMLHFFVVCSANVYISYILDECAYFCYILMFIGLDTAADIDPPGMNLGNGLCDVLGRQTAG